MSNSSIIHPDYIRVVERKVGGWSFKKGDLFYRRLPIAASDMNDFELMYGIAKRQVTVELFRINRGKAGYYLADLRHKHYYYCGEQWEDVREKLLELGIGRADPQES